MSVRGWIIIGVIVATVLVTLALVATHHRRERSRGQAGWTRSDVVQVLATVFGAAAAILAVLQLTAAPAPSSAGGPQQTTTPEAGGQQETTRPAPQLGAGLDESQAARLHEGDVSLFTEVLGDPGYRRPVLLFNSGSTFEEVEGLSEWGWARNGQYMVRAAVDDRDQVLAFSLTTLSPTFRPDIPYLSEIAEQPLRLGEATFADLSGAFDAPFEPILVRGIAGALEGRWHYAEVFGTPRPLFRDFVMVHGSTGDLVTNTVTAEQVAEVFEELGECSLYGCTADVIEGAARREARTAWPITTVTVYGENFPTELEQSTLEAEPLDDDVAEADRG